MRRHSKILFIVTGTMLLLSGCDAAITVGSRTVGIRSGAFLYEDGFLRGTYHSAFEKVYDACEKTLADLKATQIEQTRKISRGSFTAMLMDEKVRIDVEYLEKGLTSVSIMAGTSGNRIAAQLIHDRIAETLKTR